MLENLFDGIGGKIKQLAVLIFVLECIASVIGFICCLCIDDDIELFLIGLAVLVGGIIVAYISAMFLYGFGDLVESSRETAEQLKKKTITEVKPVKEDKPKLNEELPTI